MSKSNCPSCSQKYDIRLKKPTTITVPEMVSDGVDVCETEDAVYLHIDDDAHPPYIER